MKPETELEKILIEKAVGGDMAAYGELVMRYQDFIYNSICYMLDEADNAEDLAQSVFLKALENLDSFEGRAKFSTWLYSIMVNTVRTFWREKGKHNCISLEQDPRSERPPIKDTLETSEGEPWEALISRENVEYLKAAIASLHNDYREIVVLRDIEGLSYKKLAEVLDISPGTVKSRLARARNALKQQLEQVTGRR